MPWLYGNGEILYLSANLPGVTAAVRRSRIPRSHALFFKSKTTSGRSSLLPGRGIWFDPWTICRSGTPLAPELSISEQPAAVGNPGPILPRRASLVMGQLLQVTDRELAVLTPLPIRAVLGYREPSAWVSVAGDAFTFSPRHLVRRNSDRREAAMRIAYLVFAFSFAVDSLRALPAKPSSSTERRFPPDTALVVKTTEAPLRRSCRRQHQVCAASEGTLQDMKVGDRVVVHVMKHGDQLWRKRSICRPLRRKKATKALRRS
jgi:hypothetical protein